MTGADLKHLYKTSGKTSIEYAESLGISKPWLFVLFHRDDVPLDVVNKINQNNVLNIAADGLTRIETKLDQVLAHLRSNFKNGIS